MQTIAFNELWQQQTKAVSPIKCLGCSLHPLYEAAKITLPNKTTGMPIFDGKENGKIPTFDKVRKNKYTSSPNHATRWDNFSQTDTLGTSLPNSESLESRWRWDRE